LLTFHFFANYILHKACKRCQIFNLIIKGDRSAKIFKFIIKDLNNTDCPGVHVTLEY